MYVHSGYVHSGYGRATQHPEYAITAASSASREVRDAALTLLCFRSSFLLKGLSLEQLLMFAFFN